MLPNTALANAPGAKQQRGYCSADANKRGATIDAHCAGDCTLLAEWWGRLARRATSTYTSLTASTQSELFFRERRARWDSPLKVRATFAGHKGDGPPPALESPKSAVAVKQHIAVCMEGGAKHRMHDERMLSMMVLWMGDTQPNTRRRAPRSHIEETNAPPHYTMRDFSGCCVHGATHSIGRPIARSIYI